MLRLDITGADGGNSDKMAPGWDVPAIFTTVEIAVDVAGGFTFNKTFTDEFVDNPYTRTLNGKGRIDMAKEIVTISGTWSSSRMYEDHYLNGPRANKNFTATQSDSGTFTTAGTVKRTLSARFDKKTSTFSGTYSSSMVINWDDPEFLDDTYTCEGILATEEPIISDLSPK